MDLRKYKWKNRLLLIETPNYINGNYKSTKLIFEKYIKKFHQRFIKLITKRNKTYKFKIKLIGFDGTIKATYDKLVPKKIFSLISLMPLGDLKKINNKIKPKNLSLYSDYDKSTTTKNLGFKNKEKALYTIKAIKERPIKYQVSVVTTMIGRAKNHPYRNKDMDQAIKVFQKWLDDYKKSK